MLLPLLKRKSAQAPVCVHTHARINMCTCFKWEVEQAGNGCSVICLPTHHPRPPCLWQQGHSALESTAAECALPALQENIFCQAHRYAGADQQQIKSTVLGLTEEAAGSLMLGLRESTLLCRTQRLSVQLLALLCCSGSSCLFLQRDFLESSR